LERSAWAGCLHSRTSEILGRPARRIHQHVDLALAVRRSRSWDGDPVAMNGEVHSPEALAEMNCPNYPYIVRINRSVHIVLYDRAVCMVLIVVESRLVDVCSRLRATTLDVDSQARDCSQRLQTSVSFTDRSAVGRDRSMESQPHIERDALQMLTMVLCRCRTYISLFD
jgi:hypothetical protein